MEDIKTIFASNLAALRMGRQMTQAELAEQLNYSDKAVSKWERGESIPDAAVLKEIGTLFGVSMDELLTDPETLALERAAAYRREPTEEEKQQARAKHRLIQGIVQSGIWLAAALVVVILRLTLHTVFWQNCRSADGPSAYPKAVDEAVEFLTRSPQSSRRFSTGLT